MSQRFFSILLAALFASVFCGGFVGAASQPAFAADTTTSWVRVVDDNVCLYATAESSKVLFVLQKSYYLRVISEENGLYLVSVMENAVNFPQILGYVWKTEVENCDDQPLSPYYPTVRLTVDSDSAAMKLTPTPSSETVLTVTNCQQVSYYGEISNYGSTWYYVYFGGKFGYIPAENVTKPVISLHPTPLVTEVVVDPILPADTDEPTDDDEKKDENADTSATEIILIIFVAALALGICLALFLPGNLKKKDVKDVFDKDI